MTEGNIFLADSLSAPDSYYVLNVKLAALFSSGFLSSHQRREASDADFHVDISVS